jgi:predicted porin
MKKSLIALAVLILSGTAMAQSSVALYGVADTGLGKSEFDDGPAKANIRMQSYSTVNNGGSRLGVRSREDLGGGNYAAANFESGLLLTTGAQGSSSAVWNRAANVSVGGSWGQLQLGRMKSASFYGEDMWDLTDAANYSVVANTYGFAGSFGSATSYTSYVSSEIKYTSPNFSGFGVSVGYVMGNDNSGASKFDSNLTYSGGPVKVGLSVNKTGQDKSSVNWALGGNYKFGNFVVAASYNAISAGGSATVSPIRRQGFSLGGTVLFGSASITLDLTRDIKNEGLTFIGTDGASFTAGDKYTNVMVEGLYRLSKRTFLYADYLRADTTSSYGIGMRHNF